MADLGNITALKAANAAILNNSVPDESIEPDDHNQTMIDTIDTLTNGTVLQLPLVSGTNIKTVKGVSLVGSGDVPIDENATHTGEVTGATALTLDKTAISNKTLVTADPLDHVLIGDASDSDNLKKVLVSNFGGVTDGDKGDITVSGGGTVWNIDADAVTTNEILNSAVTLAKIQNIDTQKILGRETAGSGVVEELAISSDLQILLGVLGLNTTPMYISDITTVNLLDDLANWTSGNYTGTAITGTFQGQKHYNSTYFFECTHDNIWIRILRS